MPARLTVVAPQQVGIGDGFNLDFESHFAFQNALAASSMVRTATGPPSNELVSFPARVR